MLRSQPSSTVHLNPLSSKKNTKTPSIRKSSLNPISYFPKIIGFQDSRAMEVSTSEQTKLFMGGINESMKEEGIRSYFERFGEVKDLVVLRDKVTGNVRGFGFVEFLEPNAAQRALDEKDHVIGDRTVEVRRAIPRSEQRQNQSPQCEYSIFGEHENEGLSNNAINNYGNNESPIRSKKIFVGGLSSSITEDEFRSYFEKFGRITDVVIMHDNITRRPRGFGFVTFDSIEAVESVTQNKFHELNNRVVEVKVAVPKDSNNQMNFIDSNGNVGGRRGYAFNNHRFGFYSPPSPRYGHYHNYVPPVLPFYYGTTAYGYVVGLYGGISYSGPIINARNPWNNLGMVGASRSPFIYGNASTYSGYCTGGFVGCGGSAYGGRYNGNGDELRANVNVRITDLNDGTSDVGNEKLDLVEQAS